MALGQHKHYSDLATSWTSEESWFDSWQWQEI